MKSEDEEVKVKTFVDVMKTSKELWLIGAVIALVVFEFVVAFTSDIANTGIQ